jgi:hypothetical protein
MPLFDPANLDGSDDAKRTMKERRQAALSREEE